MAKWEHYKAGTDLDAIAWRDAQAGRRPNKDPYATPEPPPDLSGDPTKLPTDHGVLVGSYASIARMLDEMAAVPGVRGVMLTFDDFVIGMEQFGTRIMPLMRSGNECGRRPNRGPPPFTDAGIADTRGNCMSFYMTARAVCAEQARSIFAAQIDRNRVGGGRFCRRFGVRSRAFRLFGGAKRQRRNTGPCRAAGRRHPADRRAGQ